MKKLLYAVLTLVLSCSLICGCADNGTEQSDNGIKPETTLLDSANPVTLTMWHVYGEQADSPMNLLIKEFNDTVGEEKGVVVNVTNVSSSSKINNQLYASVEGKAGALDMPDIFSCHTTTAVTIGPDKLVDFNKYFTADEMTKYVPAFVEDGTMDGRLAVFPVSKSTYALFINGSQFEKFSGDTGVTYDSLSTWEGFFDVAEKFYEWSGGKTFCAFDYLVRHMELDVLGLGGEVNYTENGWYDMNDENIRNSFLKFAEPISKGYIGVSDLYANTQVMTGEVIAGIGSTAAITYYNDTVTYPDNTTEPTNLKVLPLPKTGGAVEYMPQTGVGIAAYYTTDQKAEAASVFLRWFTEGQRNLDFVVETGYMPVNNDAYGVIDTYGFKNDGYASLFDAIKIMRDEYTAVVRPDIEGFYGKTNALYGGMREIQKNIGQRISDGEDAEVILNEIWELFASIK